MHENILKHTRLGNLSVNVMIENTLEKGKSV